MNKIKISQEKTKFFLMVFESPKYINFINYLNGLDEFTGEWGDRRELIFLLKMNDVCFLKLVSVLLEFGIIEKQKIGTIVSYRIIKERYNELQKFYYDLALSLMPKEIEFIQGKKQKKHKKDLYTPQFY